MDDAWQAKAAPTWRSPPPPPPQPPPPTVAAPVAGSSNQVDENALPIFHSFVAQEACLQEHSMVQESLFLNSLHVGPHRLGKTELDNSVLPLLSGHAHNLSSDFLHSLSSTSGEPTFHAQGDGATICGTNISVTGISTSEIYEKTASGKGKAYPFISSRPLFVSTRNRSSVLHNSTQVGDYCYLGSDSAQPVLHQVIQAHDKRLPVSSMKRSWRNVSNTVDTSLQHTLHNQKFKKMPVEVMSASSGHASSISSGRPLVFCLNNVGELFVNERGRLGVICLCHNLNMSVAKFCEHSGSSISNPGDAVCMENGITLSQWCKLSFGLRAPGNNYEWDQPASSSARGGYRLHHNNFLYLSKNPGTSQSIESFMDGRSGEPWNNSAHYNHGAAGPYAFEKSTDSVKNNAHQWNVSNQSDFLRCSSSPLQSVTPALANNHSMLAMKGSPVMLSFGALNTKANNGGQSVGHELFGDSVNNTNRCGNHSIIYPCLDAKKSSNQNYNNSWGNFSSKQIVEGGNGCSSNTELRLGQPSQNNTAFFGSYPVTKHPHQSREMLDAQKQQLCKALTHGTICPRETNKPRPNVQCTVPEPSTLDRRSLLQASSNNNASSSSEAEGAVAYAAKNSAISLFLSHLNYIEENNLSKFTDNILNEAENIMTREPDDDSLSTKCSLPDLFRVITDATEMNSTIHETEIFDNIEKSKGLRIAERSPYNASNPSYFVVNKQATVSAVLPSIIASNYPHEASLDDNTSTMYLHQEFGSNAWNNREYEEVPFHGKCGHRGQLTCRSINSVPCSSARSCSRNTKAPKNLTSVSLVFGPESTLGLSNLKDRDKTQHLMDENLGCHAVRCTVDLSKREKLSPSLETSHQHGRMCCLSSADLQRSACKGDLIKHGELMVVPHCNFQQNASEVAARSVYSCSLCNCSGCCKSNAACTDKCLRCTATEQRIAVCSKEHDIQLPGCHICHSDPKTLLRLGRISSSSAVDSVNHEMCNQKERGSYFPGKCSCTVLSSCLTGCCVCGNNPSYVFKELGFIGKDMNVTLPSDNHILKDNRIENFGQCECSKCHSMKNEFQAALWRDVPNKVTLHSDAVLINKPARLLGVTEVIDQPAETGAKRFDMTCPEPELAKEQEMSNACSESSAPVITEVSIEMNKVDVCSAEVGNPKSVFELTVDEGSGIEKCGSSDEPLENREWKEALSFGNMVDSVSPCGEHKLKNTSKVKDRKIPSTRCMDQEEVNHQMQQQRKVCRAEKMKGPMKWKSLDASIPMSHLSTENSDSSNSFDHPFPCKEVKTPLQRDKRIKRKRSVILSKSLNLKKSENHQKFCENGEAQSSGDCALKVTKLSTLVKINQDFHVDGSKQPVIQEDKKGITGKPPKYKSLGCLKKFPNHGVDTCDGKVRPVVSGNSGIISDVPGSQQKPPKMASLSVILKTAQRCCISENEASPGLLSTSETKKVRLNANTRCRSALSSMRKGENGGCSISLRNRKESCFLLMASINKSCSNNDDRCADEGSIMKRETDCGIATSKCGNFHGYVESQPRCEETRKRSLSELTGGDRHAAKSTCILRNGESSSVTEGESVLKTYSSTCVQKNLVGRSSHCENLLDKPPSNIQLSNDCQAYQDHERCQINRRSSKRRRCQPFIFDSDAFCCVCGSSNKEQGNYLLECNGCLIRVHQACYGVPKAPKGGWYCRPCKTNSKNIVCVLCGYKGGAMTRAIKSRNIVKSLLKAWSIDIEQKSMKAIPKLSVDEFPEQSFIGEASECKESSSVLPVGSATCGDFQRDTPKMDSQCLPNIPGKTDSSLCNFQACNSIIAGVLDSSVTQWIHMVCGLWTPGTRCPNVDTMSAFDVSGTSSRKNAVCSICKRPGGSSICCRIPNCSVHFHPWCAHQKGLLQSEIEGVNNEKVGFYGRCMVHAAHNSCLVGCPVEAEVESPRQRDYNCARIEGYKGRRRDEGYRVNFQNPYNDSGGCVVSQDQINAWIHINGQKSCARGVVKPACSDVESDFRKEYMRYKQAKGWRHLVVYKSGIHALGLYTSQFIARGAMVVEYVGEIVGLRVADKREIEYQSGRKIQYKSACYFFRIDKEHIIDATRKGGIARFVNHSCLPNCVAKVISIRNEKKVVFFAERDINPGEEITYDYHFNHEDDCQKIPCFCNSRNCRRYLN